jgi:hypothetical protein
MTKLPNWVLAMGLVVAGCEAPAQSWGDFANEEAGPGPQGSSEASNASEGGVASGSDSSSGEASSTGSSGSGSSSGSSIDAGGNEAGYVVTCTSGVTSHADEGASMKPGDTCVTCHSSSNSEGGKLTIGGTVYPTAHEPTDCDGVSVNGATVVITDANGKVVTLAVNSVGNFDTSTTIATPYTASVAYNGLTLSMALPQTSGDCNSCHTVTGTNGAPGRITLP